MERYGRDFQGRPPMRYGGEYQQWGGMPRYDREFGYRGDRSGRFHQPGSSGYDSRNYGYRADPRYDRGSPDRGDAYGSRERYGRGYGQQPGQGYGNGGYAMRDTRGYPSPWDESHAGQHFGFGLGFGQGRGQFIYK